MEPALKIIAVKGSTTGIGWKPHYLLPLKTLVSIVHILVTHTFAFLKYIFIQELENSPAFALEDFANVDFYSGFFVASSELQAK
ncbi:hypothetical protein BDF14DRAFT_1727068 [Spinellus fusiger]|nr:hypothetical protein BDF14DRAFT_1727130 [Spinellus fusiger]KAI7867109.1 hypothetical protein BDF14DRAFT_1727068 [Spinellus fusiger]